MQDLAPAHNTRSTQEFLANKKVRLLEWPGNFPDLNPIENVWSLVVKNLPLTLPKNVNDLWARVQQAWMLIPQPTIHSLYRSMRSRLLAVIAAKGGPTRY